MGLLVSPAPPAMPTDPRKQAWNRVHRRALARLRAENPTRYATLYAEEAAAAGLTHERTPRRPGSTRLPDLTATQTQEESS